MVKLRWNIQPGKVGGAHAMPCMARFWRHPPSPSQNDLAPPPGPRKLSAAPPPEHLGFLKQKRNQYLKLMVASTAVAMVVANVLAVLQGDGGVETLMTTASSGATCIVGSIALGLLS